ncbi:MAG TPA: type 1 glutamine amidotransferase [Chloroflexota bacterium]|nr:type 1 glutamine amidotransferase [Chloroflexota bacterium]
MTASEWRPRTLILQHEAATPAGFIRDWLEKQGAEVEVVRIDQVEPDIDPRAYDLIVSLGSEFAAYDDTKPFVQRECRLLEEAVESEVPILGVCFGGQLLARVLGGQVFHSDRSEVGFFPVRSRDPDLVAEGPWFQWHFDSFTPPPGAELIAENDAGPQAYVIGRSLGLQFHPEVTNEIMEEWVRAFPHELEAEGVDPAELLAETQRRADATREMSRRLLERFRDTIATRNETRASV